MRRAFTAILAMCVIAVAVPPFVSSAELANGIYQVVPAGTGTPVARTSGGTVDLGRQVSSNFGEVTIWSLSNHNDLFRLMSSSAGPFDRQKTNAIYVDGICEVVNSYPQRDSGDEIQFITTVYGHANSVKLATGLHVIVQERHHPGHQLLVSWRSVEESYKIGEPIILELEIVNAGSTTVRFMEGGQQRGTRDNQFGFTAFSGSGSGKPIPDTGSLVNFGGIGGYRELKPDGVFHKKVDISKWFKFSKPDRYQITGMYELELKDKGFGVKVLWDEFATARCFVRIEK